MPWPKAFELVSGLAHTNWTLIGGLMVQLHAAHAGLVLGRPTTDVDLVLQVETRQGVATKLDRTLRDMGYDLKPPLDPREKAAHRYVRGEGAAVDIVDVLVADHAAPRAKAGQKLQGRELVPVEGGTQALRRTINARLTTDSGATATISVPGLFGALVLKSAAHMTDNRDRDRHLVDAVTLLAAMARIGDPYNDRENFEGSDGARIRHLVNELEDNPRVWRSGMRDDADIDEAKAALRILSGE